MAVAALAFASSGNDLIAVTGSSTFNDIDLPSLGGEDHFCVMNFLQIYAPVVPEMDPPGARGTVTPCVSGVTWMGTGAAHSWHLGPRHFT